MDPAKAFESAFDEKLSSLERRLQEYLRKYQGVSFTLKEPYPVTGVTVTALPAADVAATLGRLVARRDKRETARSFFAAALAMDPDQAEALAGEADELRREQRFGEAEALFERAIAAEPENFLHVLDFGLYWLERARQADDPEERRSLLGNARQRFVQADKLNDRSAEVLGRYGESFLLPGEAAEKGLDTLEFAHSLQPSSMELKLLLARAYLALNRPAEARVLANAVATWSRSSAEQEAKTQQLLAEIDARLGAETPADEDSGAEEAATDAALPAAAG